MPQHKSDKDSSTTYATLSDGNITVGGQKTTVEQLGIHTDINTANNKVDTLPNLQNILDNQKTVADATSTIVSAARTYEQNQIKQATAEKEKIQEQLQIALLSPEEREEFKTRPQEEKEAFYSNSADYVAAVAKEKLVTEKWGIGGPNSRALNAVTIAITGALGGQTDLQVATNSLSPYAAQLIGEQWGHGEDKNKAAQLTAHAILGATLAYVNGGNPAAGGSAAVAAEYAAEYFTQKYNDGKTAINPETGQFDANLLPENVKSSIRDLTAAIGAVVGGTVGDSAFNAQLAGVVGQNAVENNYLTVEQIKQFDLGMQNCKKTNTCDAVLKKYHDLSISQQNELIGICSQNAELCKQKYGFIITSRKQIYEALNQANNLQARSQSGLFGQQFEAQGAVVNIEIVRQLAKKYNISEDTAKYMVSIATGVSGRGAKGKPSGGSAIPHKDPVKANNGLTYQSNPKHTPGGAGNRPNAGIEPKNSLELFGTSYQSGKKRYAVDSAGNIHQFTNANDGTWHWAGRTGKDQPAIQRTLGGEIPDNVIKHFKLNAKKVKSL